MSSKTIVSPKATGSRLALIKPLFPLQTNLTANGVSINLAIECRCVQTRRIADRFLVSQVRSIFPFDPGILPPPIPCLKTPLLARDNLSRIEDPTGLKYRFSSL